MPNQHKILGLVDEGHQYVFPYQPPIGLKYRFVLDKRSFMWRAAEYGMDPTDSVALLDVLLHERSWSIDPNHPQFVYNTDEKTAREFMLSEIEKVKQENVFVDPDSHLDAVHQNYQTMMSIHDTHKSVVATLRQSRMKE